MGITSYALATVADRARIFMRRPPTDAGRVAVIGDSYTGGTRLGGSFGANWTRIVGVDRACVSGRGGSGYAHTGTDGTTFLSEVAKVVQSDAELVIVFGSLNDRRNDPAEVKAAALATYAKIREIAPAASILVIGPQSMAETTENHLAVRDAIASAAAEAGAAFIDPIASGWFTGENAALIGPDHIHPTDAGHRHMADLIGLHIKAALN